ncbi:6,7-dimethyl-8-ribityllumazine synthase [Roseospira visakhapatnamensis]|uniref:6,7-dimethyl-8-ribityllumazine synthase n=1 Tax=Roseospira visakhapatnamensis TaxID=390880 RepID=A0A7W6RAC4_9PROT|nr:6,7-dimethyl-8-ribityllumazine synthase [Roseospira visakhapatnamensis]MBB4264834.1 6,7-dimethyl-8-ribityllumazine synthase [Roseospira visakhapatnamensis]
MVDGARILIVEARFYDDIADNLVRGAVRDLTARGAGYKRIIVPGILEIPSVMRYAIRAMELRATDHRYSGYVLLGCAIRGETDHYEHVCREAMGGVNRLALDYSLAVGNAILTCGTRAQAMDRASPDGKNIGGMAARACLRMIEIKKEMGL